jgi:hypothetical protein
LTNLLLMVSSNHTRNTRLDTHETREQTKPITNGSTDDRERAARQKSNGLTQAPDIRKNDYLIKRPLGAGVHQEHEGNQNGVTLREGKRRFYHVH